jgi:hypothetical protein
LEAASRRDGKLKFDYVGSVGSENAREIMESLRPGRVSSYMIAYLFNEVQDLIGVAYPKWPPGSVKVLLSSMVIGQDQNHDSGLRMPSNSRIALGHGFTCLFPYMDYNGHITKVSGEVLL